MRNVKRFFSAIFMVIAVLTIYPFAIVDASAAGNLHVKWDGNTDASMFFDSYGMFDEKEENELTAAVRSYSDKLNMNIFIFLAGSSNYMSDTQTQRYIDQMYEEYYGAYTDGLIYFMDFTGKKPAYDYIFFSGTAVLQYTNRLDEIFSRMDNYLPPSSASDYSLYKDDIKDGIYSFLNHLEEISKRSPMSYYEDEPNHEYYTFKNGELFISNSMPLSKRLVPLIYAIPMGILTAIIYYFVMKSTYKFKASANPSVYLQSENTEFIRREDRFIRTYTTKHRRESSSGGGGGGGGGHSGGGHGSGGGHHR